MPRAAAERAGWELNDVDLIEVNEAFAAQAISVGKMLEWDPLRVNVNGGAIALGHPIGASGCRILVSLVHEMKKRNARKGIATLCIGGGQVARLSNGNFSLCAQKTSHGRFCVRRILLTLMRSF